MSIIHSRAVYDANMVGIHKPFAKTWNPSKYASAKDNAICALRIGGREGEREREREGKYGEGYGEWERHK